MTFWQCDGRYLFSSGGINKMPKPSVYDAMTIAHARKSGLTISCEPDSTTLRFSTVLDDEHLIEYWPDGSGKYALIGTNVNGRLAPATLKRAIEIAFDRLNSPKVAVGAFIVLHNVATNENIGVVIIDEDEPIPEKRYRRFKPDEIVRWTSPWGKQLIGHREKSRITVNTPEGRATYVIKKLIQV